MAEKITMDEIFRMHNNWMFCEPTAETIIDDFAIKCIKAGYDKDEIIDGIRDLYHQSPEVGKNIYDRAVFNFLGVKDKLKKAHKQIMKIKLSKSQWEKIGKRAGWVKIDGINI